jgi:hypothetical protein
MSAASSTVIPPNQVARIANRWRSGSTSIAACGRFASSRATTRSFGTRIVVGHQIRDRQLLAVIPLAPQALGQACGQAAAVLDVVQLLRGDAEPRGELFGSRLPRQLCNQRRACTKLVIGGPYGRVASDREARSCESGAGSRCRGGGRSSLA